MKPVDERHDFPKEEEKIVALWERLDAFRTSVARSKKEGQPEYTFYDGPPFATGLPHYGHILAGTIKDTVTRCALPRLFLGPPVASSPFGLALAPLELAPLPRSDDADRL